MKIALVSPYDCAYPGGVLVHITHLDERFTRMGHDVRVIAPASKAISGFGDRFIAIGKPRPLPSSGSIVRITTSLRLGSKIREVLVREKFDIVHLHEPLMPMLCTTVLRLSPAANVGTFHACHGRPGYDLARLWGSWMLRRWFRRLDGRIAVSRPAMDFANKYFHSQFNIIPNGVDIDKYSPEVKPFDQYQDGKLNILFVSRLERRKGLGYLLKAYAQLKAEIPDSRLIVVGPGTMLKRQYERDIRGHHIKDVVFTGFVSSTDLPRYYQTADIFCAPATGRESFGIILLEAMAAGKPIVASNIDGYASVLADREEGLLVPPQDSRALAEALGTLAQDKALRSEMGKRGRIKAERYSWERVAADVFSYYQAVLQGKTAPASERFVETIP